jgi:glycosyltransferase involved in cell wall biosynthesis
MKVPVVSINCVTYNHAPYIRQCLDGFLMQKTDFPIEVLIHDDASTDGTTDIIREYEKKYPDIIKPIYQTENQYSKGVKISQTYQYPRTQGKYIALCEGDDYWTDPYKLQKQVDFLENNPEYTITGHNAIKQDAITGKNLSLFNTKKIKHLEMKDVINHWYIPTASIVCKTSCCLKIPIWNEWVPQGDIILHMICLKEGKCKYFEDVMSVYRVMVPGSASERAKQDILKYLYGHKLLWKKMNAELNYKYKLYINRKIKNTDYRIFKTKLMIKFPFLRKLRNILRDICHFKIFKENE